MPAEAQPETPAVNAPDAPAGALKLAPAHQAAPEPDPDADLKAAARAMSAAHADAYADPGEEDSAVPRSPYARHRVGKGVLAGVLGGAFSVPVALLSVNAWGAPGWLVLPVPILASAASGNIMGKNYGSPAGFGSALSGAALAGVLGYGIGLAASSADGLADNQTARMLLIVGFTGIFTGLGATAAHSAAEDHAFAKHNVKLGLAPAKDSLLLGVSARF